MPPTLATYASHSAIQVVEGAMREGLGAVLFGPPDRLRLYRRFPALRFVEIECDGGDCLDMLGGGHILIPNGSLVEYIGWRRLEARLTLW